jgi:hypothetical protein
MRASIIGICTLAMLSLAQTPVLAIQPGPCWNAELSAFWDNNSRTVKAEEDAMNAAGHLSSPAAIEKWCSLVRVTLSHRIQVRPTFKRYVAACSGNTLLADGTVVTPSLITSEDHWMNYVRQVARKQGCTNLP